MRDTQFIFVEGIIGSGKSTTTWFLMEQIQHLWKPAQIMSEGGPLRLALNLRHPNAPWKDVTIERYIELSLRRWRAFVGGMRGSGVITVCDGLLFHGNMTDLLLMNAEPAILQHYTEQIINELAELNPVLIYLQHNDIAHALRTICDERGKKFETYQINWKVGSPYGVARSLQGFEGLIQLYQNYRATCDHIFAHLPLPKLAILHESNWPKHYHDILQFLSLPPTQYTP
jgi:hypothetical protein